MNTRGDADGYCEHGTHVGGCGIDWLCGPCEDGVSQAEILDGRVSAAVDTFCQRVGWFVKAAHHGLTNDLPMTDLLKVEAAWAAIERRDDYLFNAWYDKMIRDLDTATAIDNVMSQFVG